MILSIIILTFSTITYIYFGLYVLLEYNIFKSYNLSNYEYTRAPRSLYPLDLDMEWEPEA